MKWIKKNNFKTMKEYAEHTFKDFKNGKDRSENYEIKDQNKAADLLYKYKNKPVRIIGDYDTDGMISVTILMLLLKTGLKFSDVDYFIPDRILDGYGANPKIIDCLCNGMLLNGKHYEKTDQTGLIIMIDNGIAAIPAVKKATEYGWEVLILDHHLPLVDENKNKCLPPATVIIDPHAVECGADFIDYCGAGLGYKLAQYINKNLVALGDEVMQKICGLAAIATIGDSVKLIEENNGTYGYDNYIIVRDGLFYLTQNAGRTTGMYVLFSELNEKYETQITAEDVGYFISPTMNATSRLCLYGAEQVVDLLLQDDDDFVSAKEKAELLVQNNEDRKKYTNELIPVLQEKIKSEHLENDYPLIVTGDIDSGVLGLIAGKLAEIYNTTVIVFNNSNGVFKGSARAVAGENIKLLLDEVNKYIEGYGGHEAAAGVVVTADNFDDFKNAIQSIAVKPENTDCRYYDFEITADEAMQELSILEEYAPFGAGFEEPVFKVNFKADLIKGAYFGVIGKNANVLKLFNRKANAISFNPDMIQKYEELGEPSELVVYGRVTANIWRGEKSAQIVFDDMSFI